MVSGGRLRNPKHMSTSFDLWVLRIATGIVEHNSEIPEGDKGLCQLKTS